MCLWKQWKRVRTRQRELRALGVPDWAAFRMANSRRGAWEMSRNTNNALPTSYWVAKGLKSLLFSLSGALLTFWNRRMRTRMYGGVRGRGLAAPSYSIFYG